MNEESIGRTIGVAMGVAVFCSLIVSSAVVYLRPLHLAWAELDRNRSILQVAGLLEKGVETPDRQVVARFRDLEVRLVDLQTSELDENVDPLTYDQRSAAADPARSIAIPADLDLAGLGHRARLAPVYLLRENGSIKRIVLPITGQGMWAKIYGHISLEGDFSTVAGIAFHEQGETPAIGDRIQNPDWQTSWIGKRVYGQDGQVLIGPANVAAPATGPPPGHRFDAITGATVTVNAVTQMVAYWLGEHGFGSFLADLGSAQEEKE